MKFECDSTERGSSTEQTSGHTFPVTLLGAPWIPSAMELYKTQNEAYVQQNSNNKCSAKSRNQIKVDDP